MYWDIHYIVCHPISPQASRQGRKKQGNGRETASRREKELRGDNKGINQGNGTAGQDNGRTERRQKL